MERTRDLTTVPGKIVGTLYLTVCVLLVCVPTAANSRYYTSVEANLDSMIEVASVSARGIALLIGALIFFRLPARRIGTDAPAQPRGALKTLISCLLYTGASWFFLVALLRILPLVGGTREGGGSLGLSGYGGGATITYTVFEVFNELGYYLVIPVVITLILRGMRMKHRWIALIIAAVTVAVNAPYASSLAVTVYVLAALAMFGAWAAMPNIWGLITGQILHGIMYARMMVDIAVADGYQGKLQTLNSYMGLANLAVAAMLLILAVCAYLRLRATAREHIPV